jgi:hypothetical protein
MPKRQTEGKMLALLAYLRSKDLRRVWVMRSADAVPTPYSGEDSVEETAHWIAGRAAAAQGHPAPNQ